MGKVYALLAGINAYPPPVRQLSGCVNDIERFAEWLKGQFGDEVQALLLRDEAAKRGAIVAGFREHLGQAGPDDVALFYYAGHGAQSRSSAAFKAEFPDGYDEGLVCWDSRMPGQHDLADKELAVLLDELAAKTPHVAVLLDCCHSGSGTRDLVATDGMTVRMTEGVDDERPLQSYLDGAYLARASRDVPAPRHILMAACDRTQTAKESDGHGLFSSTLLDVLTTAGGALTYSDLFAYARAAVQSRKWTQDPQFEPMDGFPTNLGFLGADPASTPRRYSVAYRDAEDARPGAWTVRCGAINGLPADGGRPITFQVFSRASSSVPVGGARVSAVGPQESEVALDFEGDPAASYLAELTSLPVPPLMVFYEGDGADRQAIQAVLDAQGAGSQLSAAPEGTDYGLAREADVLMLRRRGDGLAIRGVRFGPGGLAVAAERIAAILTQVAQWERGRSVSNARSSIDPAQVRFEFVALGADGAETLLPGPDVDFACPPAPAGRKNMRLSVSNATGRDLYATGLYFGETFVIAKLPGTNEPAPPDGTPMTLYEGRLFVDAGRAFTLERFKLVVSTDPVDAFMLTQDGFPRLGEIEEAQRGLDGVGGAAEPVASDWLVKDLCIRVAPPPTPLAAGPRATLQERGGSDQTLAVTNAVGDQLEQEGRWPPEDASKSMGGDYHYTLPTMINFLTGVQTRLQTGDPACQFAFDDGFANAALGQDVQTLIGAIDAATG